MYEAYITTIKNLRKHSNADKLQVGECFGNQVVVDLTYKDGDIGIYFPTDGKLGQEYAEANNLVRKKDENGNNIGGYLDPEKRNIKAIKLRGYKARYRTNKNGYKIIEINIDNSNMKILEEINDD